MRLLTVGNMYPPQHLGGYELVWRSAVDHLRAAGHEVDVLTTDLQLRDAGTDPAHVSRELRWYWRDHAFPERSWRAARAVARHDARVLQARLASRPDAVLFWAMGGLPLGLLALPAGAGIPAGAVVHDGWPVYGQRVDAWARAQRGPRPVRVAGEWGSLPAAFQPDAIATWSFNSAWLRDAVLGRVPGIAPERCRVDHPGVDLARLGAVRPAGAWGWRLACVGRVDERKGLATAVEALALLPGQATLTIAGDGDGAHLDRLRDIITRLGLAGRVTFTGAVDDVAEVYADADAVLFPVTWDEPFGLVPLEAMAAGRPVVATGTGGSAEYLSDGANALLVKPGDAPALARAVATLAGDDGLRARLRDGGAQTAAAHGADGFDRAVAAVAAALAKTG